MREGIVLEILSSKDNNLTVKTSIIEEKFFTIVKKEDGVIGYHYYLKECSSNQHIRLHDRSPKSIHEALATWAHGYRDRSDIPQTNGKI